MKIFLRIVQIVLLLLVIVFLSGLFLVDRIGSRALPNYDQDVELRNMTAPVEVYRDEYAVPHIFAETEEDLYRAVGYVMAQDRMWQMDLIRRGTTGRLSEIFGEDLVETDALMRALRISEKSGKILKDLDPVIRLSLIAYADGVNQYIEQYKKKLPPEFAILGYEPEPWEPLHTINMIGYMSWDLTGGYRSKISLHKLLQAVGEERVRAFLPENVSHHTLVFPELEDALVSTDLHVAFEQLSDLGISGVFHGSNNWAINKNKVNNGKAIMCNDMHLSLWPPGIWYQMHCVVPGKLDVTGVSLPGQPFVIAGHNERIAWGMTNVGMDDTDFYIEKLNEDSTQYLFNGEWVDLRIDKEAIKTKSGDTVYRILRYTHRGPIISTFRDIDEAAISMRWIGNEASNEVKGVYLLNHAKNWNEFRTAASNFKSVSQNIVYADVDGNIGLQNSAGVPLKKDHYYSIYPGETDEYDWIGLMDFDKLPNSYNPDNGMVSSANNRVAGEHYPFFISHWPEPHYRIDRIRQLLNMQNGMGVTDMMAIHLDQYSLLYEDLKPLMVAILNNAALNEKEQEAFTILKTFDGEIDKNAAAPCILETFYMKFLEHSMGDELDSLHYDMVMRSNSFVKNYVLNVWGNSASPWMDDVNTAGIEGFNNMVMISFKSTVEELVEKLGKKTENWRWGDMHQLTLEHPMGGVKLLDRLFNLNRGPYPMNGDCFTVAPFSFHYYDPYEIYFGPSHRHIFTTDDWDQSKTIIPTGTSGIPKSPFYCDQTELYVNGKYHNDYVSKELIRANSVYRMTIK
ncbi:MAG: penicillin acylase family protein [Candidatus Marinimicrobia bacterium]|nr:penicillin acylase family protein [Candidatus Neomarinimicrobiota bacterium]